MPRRVVLLHGLWMPGLAPEVFSYASVADGPDNAVPRLVELLRREDADIVAHSLGGLIALQALCDAPELLVRRVVCLGSPLRGSGAAAGLMRFPLSTLMLGRSAGLLRQGFACWQGRAEVGVIAGHVPHGLGALFGHFDADHDGTVAVAETRLEGVTDHVVIAASHSGLLFSAEAAAQAAAFLRDGRFMPVDAVG